MSGPRARLFVALELAAAARTALAQWTAGLSGAGLRPVGADALHVTLCFLADVGVGEVPAITAALGSLPLGVVGTPGIARTLWLPARQPRVLAVELTDPAGALGALQARIAAALQSGGWYRPERRRYLPHVTVARVRGAAGASATEVPQPPELRVAADAVALLRSHLGAGPARYERLANWPIR